MLSGNRNFEGRIHANVRANYLASPPLVVAYALAGSMNVDLYNDPLGNDQQGKPVYLKDIWPSPQEVNETMRKSVRQEMFKKEYSQATEGDAQWQKMPVPRASCSSGTAVDLRARSALFRRHDQDPERSRNRFHRRARAGSARRFGDHGHISPAGAIEKNGPAARYLNNNDVPPKDYNSVWRAARQSRSDDARNLRQYSSEKHAGTGHRRRRHGSHPGQKTHVDLRCGDAVSEGRHAAGRYRRQRIRHRLSRDWAAKGPRLLGIKAAIAESFERIHRSNLIGMGIVPLVFKPGENLTTHGLTGFEKFDILGIGRA